MSDDAPVLTVQVERQREAAVVHLRGEIDAMSCRELTRVLADLETVPQVGLDLADVSYIDSSGLRVLILAYNAATDQGRTLRLLDRSPAVDRLLELSGLATYFGDVPPT